MGFIGAVWGLGGPTMLLLWAIFRLTPIAVDSFSFDLQWYHWLVLLANILFMAYSEGYRGFQLGYSPRLAARALNLARHPSGLRVALAPLFCMGYFHTTRHRMIAAYALTFGIIILIILVQRLDQPWRGILDAGVVVGLAWGVIATVIYGFKAFIEPNYAYSPELPGQSAAD